MSLQPRPVFARACLLALQLAVPACGGRSAAEPGSRRVVGIIDNGGTGIAPLIVPDTVYVGVPFLATVTTFGGACDHPDGSDVSTRGLLADVTPYDLLPPPETICIAILRASPRSIELTFATPGAGVVRVHGRRFDGGDVTLQRAVVVRP
jgi:hypothetical protein